MRPLLPHAPHVAKPSLTWLHRQATQQKQQLHTRSYRHSCFKRQIQITGLLQFDMNITSAFQQHLNSLLQPLQYLPLSMPTPASTTHSRQSGSDVKATALWHGVDVQQSAKLKCNLPEASTAALQALSVHSMDKLQDVLNCLLLAETAYRVHDHSNTEVARFYESLQQDFPAPLTTIENLQWSQRHVSHRYLLATSRDALYVAFVGTKQRRDIMTNANIMQEPLWPSQPQAQAAAHSGFLYRARGVPIAALYAHARKANKRLVLTGHSLGGAVALLCTLDLLHQQGHLHDPAVACVGFATPAVGNMALSEHVSKHGWQKHITNYLVPEDVVTRLLPSQQMPALNKAAASEGEPTAAAPADQMFSHHPALWESLASPADPSPHSQHPPVNVLPTEQHSPATSQPGAMQLLEASRSSSMHARPHAVSSTRSAVPTQSQAENSRQRQQHLPQPAAPSSASLNRSMPGAMNNILPWRRKEHYAELMSRGRNHAHGRPADQEGHCNNIGRMESVLSQTCKGNSLTTSGNRHSSGSNSSTVSSSGSASQPVLSSPTDSTHNAEDQSQPGAASTDEAAPGFWSRTAKLAHLVSFPIRMSRAYYSYVPVGRQLYLQPSGLTSTLHAAAAGTAEVPAQAQSPVAANMETKLGSSTINADGNSSSSSKQDAVVQRRKELLGRLWMHRMPTYRARIQQILYAALGQDIPEASMGWDPVIHPIPASAQTHSPVQLARRPVAPKLEVMRAETSTCALLGSNHFKEVLKGGMSAVADQTVRRWFWPRTGLLTALRNQLPAWQDDIHLQINVSGHGLQHCSSISVSDGTNVMQATVVHKSSSGAALPARKTLTEMAVDVAIPWSVMQNLYGHLASTGELSLTLTAQSDFYVISLPVTLRSDVQALQDRVESMLSVCKTLSALVIRRALCNAAILHAFKFVE